MLKPKILKKGDTIATVSLSWGGAGEEFLQHRYKTGKRRLEEEFGLKVIEMPNSLKGEKFLYEHPELRAKDLMDAFRDPNIKAIISNTGGDDTIRLLPYIDFNVIRDNPKIFIGNSDSTVNHFMLQKAGLVSFYGPTVLSGFAENVEIHDYTKKSIKDNLFKVNNQFKIEPCEYWTSERIEWKEENSNIRRKMQKDKHGYEVLQGEESARGKLLGGCIELFLMMNGTKIWPTIEEWNDKILFLETSDDQPDPELIKYILRNLQAQGVLDVINGIIVGKPVNEKYYEEYKQVYKTVIGEEAKRPNLPIMYNVNFGHTSPTAIIPYGIECELDCKEKQIKLLESPVQKEKEIEEDFER